MESKTPKFDKLLDEILENLTPHKRECLQSNVSKYCEGIFEITKEDIEFYKMLKVPPPKCCSVCRKIRRFSFVNTNILYKHPNNAPEKSGYVISFVPPISALSVYDVLSYQKIFEPYAYAKKFDETIDFFSQFYNLRLKVPQPAIIRDPSSINSEYSLNGRNLKNGYWVSGGWNSEDVWYSGSIFDSREIMDCYKIRNSEKCYESVDSRGSYNCSYLYFSENCIDSQLLYDCRNCQNCFGCVNLRNRRYYLFNNKLSKEAYEKELQHIHFKSRKHRKIMFDKFWSFIKTQPLRAPRIEHSKDVDGVIILDSKNCHNVINCEKSEHERHVDSIVGHKDSMDVYVSGGSEKLYETAAVGSQCSNVKFSFASKFITDSEFLINCRNCSNCFACIGLENKSYCILNKQYHIDDYFKELDHIKTSMMKSDQYGEFLPYKFSTFAYNGSSADMPFPLNKNEIQQLGALWQPDIEIDGVNMITLSPEEVPDSIVEVDDSILTKAIICEETGKPFRIVNSELEFYRKHNIPIPVVHPYKRIRNRNKYVGNRMINKTVCSSCKKGINSMYDTKEDLILYCDECYKREFI